MKTEQIVSYLLVTTIMMIFTVLVVFTMQVEAGNGGEYWGYDKKTDPFDAAVAAWERGDYRFLDVNLPPFEEQLTNFVPGVGACTNHPHGDTIRYRHSSGTPLHSDDSLRLAAQFASRFNLTLARSLNFRNSADCEVSYQWFWRAGEIPGLPRE